MDILKQYLDHERASVQTSALDAIRQIWWDISDHNPQVKALIYIEASRQTEFLPSNPTKHDLPELLIKEQFQCTKDKE